MVRKEPHPPERPGRSVAGFPGIAALLGERFDELGWQLMTITIGQPSDIGALAAGQLEAAIGRHGLGHDVDETSVRRACRYPAMRERADKPGFPGGDLLLQGRGSRHRMDRTRRHRYCRPRHLCYQRRL